MKLVKYENCIPVRGASRSLLCDLQRNDLKLIPNSLCEILEKHNAKSIPDIKKAYNNEYNETIDEYVAFLIENEYAFLTDNSEWFPPISKKWYSYNKITNAILDFGVKNKLKIEKLLVELSELGCEALQIRFFGSVQIDELKRILIFIKENNLSVLGIEILVKFNDMTNKNRLVLLMNNFPRLMSVIVYNSPKKSFFLVETQNNASIRFIKKNIPSQKSCGLISKDLFSINMSMFTESLNHNSCLNRKISIDINGNIKNCPSMPESFGNIKDTTLQEALNKPGFKKYWNITKNQIEICKDCEFRHVCTDCRAYTERTKFKDDIDLSKPLKCGYNPYTNEWAEWSTNPLKEKAIEYYEMQELVKKD